MSKRMPWRAELDQGVARHKTKALQRQYEGSRRALGKALAELRECREALAAAEAREQEWGRALELIIEIDNAQIPDAREAATAMRKVAIATDIIRKIEPAHAALDAYVEERTAELREQLAAAQREIPPFGQATVENTMADLKSELAECREALAAAEARETNLLDALTLLFGKDWLLQVDDEELFAAIEAHGTSSRAALDAALEQARQEGREEILNQMGSKEAE